MSIPKEPRQLMVNLMYLVLTALLALNVSAEILNAFNTVNKGIGDSNELLNSKNENFLDISLPSDLPHTTTISSDHNTSPQNNEAQFLHLPPYL